MNKLEMLHLRLEGLTYQEIAVRAGISRQRVQQLLSPPTAVRNYVVEKYGGKCKSCGIYVGTSGHVHHTDSSVLEDYNDMDNLELLCLGCHRRAHINEPLSMPTPIDRGPELLEEVKRIQKERKLTDTQISELLDYKDRTGWARIKGGIVPANEVFQMRALRAFPELHTAPAEASQDSHSKGIKGLLDKIVLKVKKFV